MQKSPLAIVKDRFGKKQELLTAVKALAQDDLWLDRLNEDKGLSHVSNKKLLHLHEVLSAVKKEHGTRARLVEAILAGGKREKDADYRGSLERRSTPALYELWRSGQKRVKPKSS